MTVQAAIKEAPMPNAELSPFLALGLVAGPLSMANPDQTDLALAIGGVDATVIRAILRITPDNAREKRIRHNLALVVANHPAMYPEAADLPELASGVTNIPAAQARSKGPVMTITDYAPTAEEVLEDQLFKQALEAMNQAVVNSGGSPDTRTVYAVTRYWDTDQTTSQCSTLTEAEAQIPANLRGDVHHYTSPDGTECWRYGRHVIRTARLSISQRYFTLAQEATA